VKIHDSNGEDKDDDDNEHNEDDDGDEIAFSQPGIHCRSIAVYEDGFVEYILGGVRFEVTEGTDVLDRQDVYWADMNEKSTDTAGNECDISVYPMFTVKHRVIISPMIDELI
jgi:hypothetical protein